MKIWIYWSESNSRIYFYIFLNKNWKIYWSEQSSTGLEQSFTGLSKILLVLNKVLLVLDQRTGAFCEDCILAFNLGNY
jgi:hypothetical protein